MRFAQIYAFYSNYLKSHLNHIFTRIKSGLNMRYVLIIQTWRVSLSLAGLRTEVEYQYDLEHIHEIIHCDPPGNCQICEYACKYQSND